MHCVRQSLNGTCVALCVSLCRFVSGSCPHTPVWRCQFFFAVSSVSFFISHSVFSFFNSIQFNFFQFTVFCFLHLHTMHPALQACRKRFGHLLSLPAENWTCLIEADPHVHCVHSMVHVHLDHRSISNISKCGFFSSSTTIFPAGTTF